MAELEQQMIDLQARVTFQEDMLQSLDKIVAQQNQTISLLQVQLERWQSRFDELADNLESSTVGGIEKPPHY
ncbi:hypothetical protein AB835_05395 [Candidatus Endobugula sertula]|uniref:Protein SlyX homolog n=1 Tax=Candidatus Endobugula sertula TaxID=62101 RepID=A0A1D2QR75_9GAMM|nr:hypothetical protein AB835_05395 [Candidatus Endobugula sertula]